LATWLQAALLSQVKLKHFYEYPGVSTEGLPIPRCALVDTHVSSFERWYHSQNDQVFITSTGLDYSSFQHLLSKFSPLYNHYSPYSLNGKIIMVQDLRLSTGWPCSLGPADYILSYAVFLKFSMRLLFKVLKEEVDARVTLSSMEEIAEYQDVVRRNFPALDGSWCVMDGLKIPIQKSGDESMQNVYYNGWLHSHFVGCFLVFAPSGVFVACTLNAPGCWHDILIAENSRLYDKLELINDTTGGIVVVDAAFSKKHCPFSIKLGKCKPGELCCK
jgi:hypothetical protein